MVTWRPALLEHIFLSRQPAFQQRCYSPLTREIREFIRISMIGKENHDRAVELLPEK
jgi:hypothetical protein